MKKALTACAVLICVLVSACSAPINKENNVNSEKAHFTYEFADVEKGRQLLLGNTEYHNNYTKTDLEYRLQKKGATKEEYLEFAKEQVMEFTQEEKELLTKTMTQIENIILEEGYKLPEIDTVNFVKTTMDEEGKAGAYTHKSDIYLGVDLLDGFLSAPEDEKIYYTSVILHELFHCLTRNNPDFRRDMYEIIGFTVTEKDFEISPRIRERMISNPDVGNHDSYASFTINGEKKDCFAIYYATKEFENEGDMFFDNAEVHLVPVDNSDTLYTMDDAEDFWDIFGKNTEYVIDPEECLADNFSYAFLINQEGYKEYSWESPEILGKILKLLKAENK